MRRHRFIVGALVSFGVFGAFAGVGCSSSSSSTPAPDLDAAVAETSTPDTSVADTSTPPNDAATVDAADAADAADSATADASANCATGPYQAFDPLMATISGNTPATSVTVGTNICTATAVIPFGGMTSLNVPSNTPFFFISTQTGNLPVLAVERNIKFSGIPKIGYVPTMLPSSYALAVDPAWDPTNHALLNIDVNIASGSGACSAKDGVSYTVSNHASVVIRYAHGGTTSTGTGNSGDSLGTWISIPTTATLASPEYVTITQTKAGCNVGLTNADKLFFTGRAPLAAGYLTMTLTGEVTN